MFEEQLIRQAWSNGACEFSIDILRIPVMPESVIAYSDMLTTRNLQYVEFCKSPFGIIGRYKETYVRVG
jgi:hypothetical protein